MCGARGVGLEPGPGQATARAPDWVQFRHTGPDPGRRARQRLLWATHGRIFCWPAHFSCSQPARRDRTIVSVDKQATRHHLLQNCNSATFQTLGYSPDNDLVLANTSHHSWPSPGHLCEIQREISKTEQEKPKDWSCLHITVFVICSTLRPHCACCQLLFASQAHSQAPSARPRPAPAVSPVCGVCKPSLESRPDPRDQAADTGPSLNDWGDLNFGLRSVIVTQRWRRRATCSASAPASGSLATHSPASSPASPAASLSSLTLTEAGWICRCLAPAPPAPPCPTCGPSYGVTSQSKFSPDYLATLFIKYGKSLAKARLSRFLLCPAAQLWPERNQYCKNKTRIHFEQIALLEREKKTERDAEESEFPLVMSQVWIVLTLSSLNGIIPSPS